MKDPELLGLLLQGLLAVVELLSHLRPGLLGHNVLQLHVQLLLLLNGETKGKEVRGTTKSQNTLTLVPLSCRAHCALVSEKNGTASNHSGWLRSCKNLSPFLCEDFQRLVVYSPKPKPVSKHYITLIRTICLKTEVFALKPMTSGGKVWIP